MDSLGRARGASFAAYQKGVVSLIVVLQADENLLRASDARARAQTESACAAVTPSRHLVVVGSRRDLKRWQSGSSMPGQGVENRCHPCCSDLHHVYAVTARVRATISACVTLASADMNSSTGGRGFSGPITKPAILCTGISDCQPSLSPPRSLRNASGHRQVVRRLLNSALDRSARR